MIEIEKLNSMEPDKVRFKHLQRLRSGHDQFSGLKIYEMRNRIDASEIEQIEKAFEYDPVSFGSCMRWRLRGLRIDLAIRKVKADLEVGRNARRSRGEFDGMPEAERIRAEELAWRERDVLADPFT